MVEAAVAVEEVEVMVVMVPVLALQAGKVIAIVVASRGIGPVTIVASSPRRTKRNKLSQPKKRSQPCYSLRFNMWHRRSRTSPAVVGGSQANMKLSSGVTTRVLVPVGWT
jgi:hypothetical protein